MAILGFNYTKLNAEKMKPASGKVNINNNVSISDCEEQDISVTDQSGLKIEFTYNSSYEPEVAKIQIKGNLLYADEDDVIEEMKEEWEENNSFSKEKMKEIINYVLGKCNVQAITMSKDLNIPSPIPLPKVGDQE